MSLAATCGSVFNGPRSHIQSGWGRAVAVLSVQNHMQHRNQNFQGGWVRHIEQIDKAVRESAPAAISGLQPCKASDKHLRAQRII